MCIEQLLANTLYNALTTWDSAGCRATYLRYSGADWPRRRGREEEGDGEEAAELI